VEAELAGLAASGATTLVGLMVSDAWAQVRDRVARFLARDGDAADSAAVERQLQEDRQELVAARDAGDGGTAADVEAGWRLRLRRLLLADPAAAAELRALLAELEPRPTGGPVVVVHNTFSGGSVRDGTVIQGQDFSHFTLHTSPPRPAPGGPGE